MPTEAINRTEMKERVLSLESNVGVVREEYSGLKQHMETMSDALSKLADVRAETLHIIKQQEQNLIDHEGIFKRMRETELAVTSNSTNLKTAMDDIKSLKKNQRWAVITPIVVVAGSIVGVITKKYLNG